MKKNWLLIAGIALLLAGVVWLANSGTPNQTGSSTANHEASHPPIQPQTNAAQAIPAHYEHAPSRASLGPTLEPEKFSGVTREAYRAVREIPQTIAQLPCYCHCDRGMGHKSLYSCFEDDHAAHCATCINEALLALKLEREQKLTPVQIRDRIVAQYSQ